MRFHGFQGSEVGGLQPRMRTRPCPSRNLCSIPACCYLIDFHGFHLLAKHLVRFHGFEASEVGRLWHRMRTRFCSSKNLCSILAGCYIIDFHRFHVFSVDLPRFHGFQGSEVGGLCLRLAPKETFAQSQLAAISSIFMDIMCCPWIS